MVTIIMVIRANMIVFHGPGTTLSAVWAYEVDNAIIPVLQRRKLRLNSFPKVRLVVNGRARI